jgi:hypothetical protein
MFEDAASTEKASQRVILSFIYMRKAFGLLEQVPGSKWALTLLDLATDDLKKLT